MPVHQREVVGRTSPVLLPKMVHDDRPNPNIFVGGKGMDSKFDVVQTQCSQNILALSLNYSGKPHGRLSKTKENR